MAFVNITLLLVVLPLPVLWLPPPPVELNKEFVLLPEIPTLPPLVLVKVANNAEAAVDPTLVVKPNEYKSYFNGLLLLEDVSNNSVDMENN